MKTLVFRNTSGSPLPKASVRKLINSLDRYLSKCLPAAKRKNLKDSRELVVVFVTDQQIKKLNKQYRGKNYVTDILSFASEDQAALGELVLSPAKIRRQSMEHGLSFHEELSYMLIHGVLHLLGYDHERSEAEARRMFRLQDEAFEKLR